MSHLKPTPLTDSAHPPTAYIKNMLFIRPTICRTADDPVQGPTAQRAQQCSALFSKGPGLKKKKTPYILETGNAQVENRAT